MSTCENSDGDVINSRIHELLLNTQMTSQEVDENDFVDVEDEDITSLKQICVTKKSYNTWNLQKAIWRQKSAVEKKNSTIESKRRNEHWICCKVDGIKTTRFVFSCWEQPFGISRHNKNLHDITSGINIMFAKWNPRAKQQNVRQYQIGGPGHEAAIEKWGKAERLAFQRDMTDVRSVIGKPVDENRKLNSKVSSLFHLLQTRV